jgi:ribosome modulation factor
MKPEWFTHYQYKYHKLGQIAYIQGKDISDCPWSLHYEKSNYWLGGWEMQWDFQHKFMP